MNSVLKYIKRPKNWTEIPSQELACPPGNANVQGFKSWNDHVCIIFVNEDQAFIHVALMEDNLEMLTDMVCDSILQAFFYHTEYEFHELPIPKWLKDKVRPSRHFRMDRLDPASVMRARNGSTSTHDE